jgi:dephospho-CoA kinase
MFMLKIGITGGIGSGKSLVAKMFNCLGAPVFNADDASKMLIATDANLIKGITHLLGEEAYQNNQPNKVFIANAIFNNTELLTKFNAIVHPAVIAYGQQWIQLQAANYIIREAAILFESNTHKNLDAVIGISAPLHLRVSRAIKRDNSNEANILARINNQMNEEEKLAKCDYIIYNNNEQALLPQVLHFDSFFKQGKLP